MKEGDIIIFKYEGTTLKYTVYRGVHGYFLNSESGDLNRKIFILLKIEDRFAFCGNIIGYKITNTGVDFPVIDNLENLEKIVNALYQRIIDISIPKFKKGEKVKIVPKCGSRSDYPFLYTQEMEKLVNITDTIVNINKVSIGVLKQIIYLEKYQEPFTYCLQNHLFAWASAMLEPVNEDEAEGETKKTISEPHDLSVMQKESVEIYDTTKADSILLPPKLAKTDINTQTVTFGNIKTTTGTISFEEEKDSNIDYKLNFTVNSLDFKK